MQASVWASTAGMIVGCACAAVGGVEVRLGRSAWGDGFRFDAVPLPSNNDAATGARFTLVDGAGDRAGGGTAVLHDGLVPSDGDQPAKNFFFQGGRGGGRLLADLGRVVSVREVNTYSWHTGTRGRRSIRCRPQKGVGRAPKRGFDPEAEGWRRLARVDTRLAEDDGGGQCGVSVCRPSGILGSFRHILFDMEPTERSDPFGNTFYSEIDVVDTEGPVPTSDASLASQTVRLRFATDDGHYRFAIDVTVAADLKDWSNRELRRVVSEWYPKLVPLLASDGCRPPCELLFRFREDMGGTPASAGGGCVNLNAIWFRRALGREALGAVVHEMVHVVQNYGKARRDNPKPAPAPGWVIEGISDYVRWFLYEPQSRGAEITKKKMARAKYDGSYRISANFLDWVTRTFDRDLVKKLNAAVREGRYDESLWRTWSGKSVQQLGEEWLVAQRSRLIEGR